MRFEEKLERIYLLCVSGGQRIKRAEVLGEQKDCPLETFLNFIVPGMEIMPSFIDSLDQNKRYGGTGEWVLAVLSRCSPL